MKAAFLQFIQNAFKIRPDELRRVGMAALYLFFAIGSFIMARITRSTLFLEIPDYKKQLPFTYIGVAVVVPIGMYAYARVERKLRRDHTNFMTLVGLTVVTILFRLLLLSNAPVKPVYWAFYLWVEIFGAFLVVQFWSFTNELFNARQAKRVFAIIGGGGVLANVFFGFGTKSLVAWAGTENTLWFIAACLVVCAVIVWGLGHEARADLEEARQRAPKAKSRDAGGASKQGVFATRHVQLIALVVMLTYLVSTLVDYQWQVIIGDSIPSKAGRGAYFGNFFGYTGILAACIQFFLTSRLLERFGVSIALLLLPCGMLFGSASLLMAPVVIGGYAIFGALGAVTFTKGSENVLRYTVNDSTLQLLYLPVPAHLRGRSKAFIDGILKPISIGCGGLLAALLFGELDQFSGGLLHLNWQVHNLSWVVGGALGAWIIMLFGLRREYVRSLMQTLQRRRLNFADAHFHISDDATVRMLDTILRSSDHANVVHAFSLLQYVTPSARSTLDATVVSLLGHPEEEVRVLALEHLGQSAGSLHQGQVSKLLTDSSARVRAAAVLAHCAQSREQSVHSATLMLADEVLRVRAAAVAGMIRHGGLDGMLSAADDLKAMLSHQSEHERASAAWVLGEIGLRNFYQPLLRLLDDHSERVSIAAVEASARLRCPELVPALIAQLGRPRLSGGAATALSAYGTEVYEAVVRVFTDPTQPRAVRAQIPRVLERLSHPDVSKLLCTHMRDDDVTVRSASLHALVSLVHHQPETRIDVAVIDEALRIESRGFLDTLALIVDLDLGDEAPLLTDALSSHLTHNKSRILSLLSLKYPPKTIELVSRNLQSTDPRTRANAVEVLDNLLGKEEKPFLVPLFDEAPPAQTLQICHELFELRRGSRQERLMQLLSASASSSDDWLQACSALAVGALRLTELTHRIDGLLDHTNPVCRETAILVLVQLQANGKLSTRLSKLVDDPAPAVRRYAQHIREGGVLALDR